MAIVIYWMPNPSLVLVQSFQCLPLLKRSLFCEPRALQDSKPSPILGDMATFPVGIFL